MGVVACRAIAVCVHNDSTAASQFSAIQPAYIECLFIGAYRWVTDMCLYTLEGPCLPLPHKPSSSDQSMKTIFLFLTNATTYTTT